jgi:hypothetical protein
MKIATEDDDGFEEELERRVADHDAGRTTASDWSVVAARLERTFRKTRPDETLRSRESEDGDSVRD